MFEELGLDDSLCAAVSKMGFKKPTSIQEKAIEVALDGADVLASAPTGTGKTAAFLLPAMQHLLDFPREEHGSARVLVLTPTRELAIQIYQQALELGEFCEFECGVITGGINYGTDRDTLSRSLDILIATPGRLFEHIEQESFDCRDIECLILDEADRMLDMGFRSIVNQISSEARWRKQSMLFSATLEGHGIQLFSEEILNNPVEVTATPTKKETGKIVQWYHLADNAEHKYALLKHYLSQSLPSVIVFVKTREQLAELRDKITSDGHFCSWLQGEMPQDKRNLALENFREGKSKILIATDVAARGIDIPDVSHVINYDMPRSADVYVHRIGRTARAGKKGTAISLVEAHDFAMMGKVQRYTQSSIKPRIIEELRPKHKAPSLTKPKKKKKAAKKKGK